MTVVSYEAVVRFPAGKCEFLFPADAGATAAAECGACRAFAAIRLLRASRRFNMGYCAERSDGVITRQVLV